MLILLYYYIDVNPKLPTVQFAIHSRRSYSNPTSSLVSHYHHHSQCKYLGTSQRPPRAYHLTTPKIHVHPTLHYTTTLDQCIGVLTRPRAGRSIHTPDGPVLHVPRPSLPIPSPGFLLTRIAKLRSPYQPRCIHTSLSKHLARTRLPEIHLAWPHTPCRSWPIHINLSKHLTHTHLTHTWKTDRTRTDRRRRIRALAITRLRFHQMAMKTTIIRAQAPLIIAQTLHFRLRVPLALVRLPYVIKLIPHGCPPTPAPTHSIIQISLRTLPMDNKLEFV